MNEFDNVAKPGVFSATLASRSRQACLGDQRLRGDGRHAVLATIKPSLEWRSMSSRIHLYSWS
jgi:hypothetical protein